MIINFKNTSKKTVQLFIDEEEYEINPYKNKKISCTKNEKICFSICPIGKSTTKTDMHHILLKTDYSCFKLYDNKEFIITREKIRFSYNAFYERFFLNDNDGACLLNSISVKDDKQFRKSCQKRNKLKFLYHPFEDFLGPQLLFWVGGMLLSFILGWKFAIIYFSCLLIFLFFIEFISKRLLKCFFKKICKYDEEKDFNDYLNPEYIWEYYSIPNREPFMGKIEYD